jgi:hypothetical protein
LPLEIAVRIHKEPVRYPAELLSLAEARVNVEVTRTVTPVGTIAAREKWFT